MDALSSKLRPWMRFHPPDDKVINDLLRAKITGNDELVDFIPGAQSCKWEPWDLKNLCGIKTNYPEWWFFSPLDLKNRSGKRSNRATNAGFWKVTGKEKKIMSGSEWIGKKTFLVFYTGRGKGKKTNWVIHEYSSTLNQLDGTHPGQKAFVLCRLSYNHEKSIKHPSINDARPAVSSPATSTAAECDDKHFNAHAAENQLGQLTISNADLKMDDMIIEPQQIAACDVLTPPTSSHNNPTVSSSTAAKSSLEEIESTRGLDSVSYNACAARNEVPEATVMEFEEGLSLSDLPSEPPDCNLSSWFPTLDMQFGMSDLITHDSNNSPCGTYFQYGASEPAAYGYEFSDPTLDCPSEYIQNTFVGQKNHTLVSVKDNGSFSDPTLDCPSEYIQNTFVGQKNHTLVSVKDNGSSGGSDAKMANKPLECCDQISYNACTAKNHEVLEVIASEVDLQLEEVLSMFDLLPKPPDCNLDMPISMPSLVTVDSNNSHCGMDFQYATNDLATYGYEFEELKPDYLNANFPNTFGSQENLTMVSIKDSESCVGPDAKLANAPFESTFQDFGEISQRNPSSGLINLESHMVWMGNSSNKIKGSDNGLS